MSKIKRFEWVFQASILDFDLTKFFCFIFPAPKIGENPLDLDSVLASGGQCQALPHEFEVKSLTQTFKQSKKSNQKL